MSDGRIDSAIDSAKVNKELESVIVTLERFEKLVENFPQIKSIIDNEGSFKKASQAQTELKKGSDELAKINAQIEVGERKLIALRSESAKQLIEQRLAMKELNKEQQLRIKISQAEEGSIEQLNLKLDKARGIYDKLGESQRNSTRGQTLLKFIQDTSKAFDAQRASTDRFQQRVGNYEGSAKIIVEAFERARQKLNQVERDFGTVSPEAKRARGEFEALERITGQPQFLNISAKVGDANAELKFFTKQLIQLETLGQKNTTTYKEVETRLAQLTDQIADTRQEVKALSSDSRGFDLFAGSVTFAADAFQTFAGAAQLAGVSEKDAAQATATLVAIQSVSNGVKGIAVELTTKGTAANKAFTFIQRQMNIVMAEGIVTANGLKAALGLLGIAATVIGAIAIAVSVFSKSNSEAAAKQKNLNDVMKEAGTEYARVIEQVNKLRTDVDLAKKGFISKKEVVKEYNEGMGKVTGQVKELDEVEKKLNEHADEYIQFMFKKALATAAFAKAAQLAVDQQLELLKPQDVSDLNVLSTFGFKQGDELFDKALKRNEEKRKEAQASVKNQIDALFEFAKNQQKSAAADAKKFKFDFFGGGDEKDNKADFAERNRKAKFDALKQELEDQARIQRQIVEIDTFSLSDRQDALRNFIALKKQLIEEETKFELGKKGLTAEEVNTIEKKKLLDLQHVGDEVIKLFKDVGKAAVEEFADEIAAMPEEAVKILEQAQKRIDDFVEKSLRSAGIVTEKQIAEQIDAIKKLIKEAEVKDVLTDSFQTIATTADDVFGGIFDRQKNRIQEQIDDIERLKAAEIDRINASGDGEEKKAARIKIVEAKAQADREALQKKQRELDRQKAIAAKIFNVFQLTIDGIQAVSKAKLLAQLARLEFLAKGGPANPLAIPFGIAAALAQAQVFQTIITSAAAVVAAAAAPIPKFFRGKKASDRYTGPGIVGDAGAELGIFKSGEAKLFTEPTLTHLVHGDVILPNRVTEKILGGMSLERMSGSTANGTVVKIDNGEIVDRLDELISKSGIIIHNEPGIETTARYQYHMKN